MSSSVPDSAFAVKVRADEMANDSKFTTLTRIEINNSLTSQIQDLNQLRIVLKGLGDQDLKKWFDTHATRMYFC